MDIFDEIEREREHARDKSVKLHRRRPFPWNRTARIGGIALAVTLAFGAGVWMRPMLPIKSDDFRNAHLVVPMATVDDVLGRKGIARAFEPSSRDSDLAVRNALASRGAVGQMESDRDDAAGVLAELEAEHARQLQRLNDARSRTRRHGARLAEVEAEAEDAVAVRQSAVRNVRETQAKLERSAYRALMAVSAAFNTAGQEDPRVRELRRAADHAKARLDEVKRYAKNPKAPIAELRKRSRAAARKTGQARAELAEAKRAEARAAAAVKRISEAIGRASQDYMAGTIRVSEARRTAELAAWDAIALSGSARRAASIDAYEKLISELEHHPTGAKRGSAR